MASFTKKWQKDFLKRYSNTIKSLQDLENEFSQMLKDNPDDSWELSFMSPEVDTVNFEQVKDSPTIFHTEKSDQCDENVEFQFATGLGYFNFKMSNLDELIKFRNDLMQAIDKFNRPPKSNKEFLTDDCEEDDEDWENNEETEYTIQASRTCVQTWTHTVMARTSCEAYRKLQEDADGSTHDENDSIGDYGEISFEII